MNTGMNLNQIITETIFEKQDDNENKSDVIKTRVSISLIKSPNETDRKRD